MKTILPMGSDLETLLQNTIIENECFIWTRNKSSNGYPKVRFGSRTIGAHRLALFYATGVWGEVAQHSCDIPLCINPKHLSWGTSASNSADMVAKNRQAQGSKIKQSKLVESQVTEIRRAYATGSTSWRKLAQDYGVSKTVIGYIVTNKRWHGVGK